MHSGLSFLILTKSTIIRNENQFYIYGQDRLWTNCLWTILDGTDAILFITFHFMSLTNYEFIRTSG
jgi:hypothetical protein